MNNSQRRLVPKAYRHIFTLEADEIIRVEYRRMLIGRRPYSVKNRLGEKLRVPGWVTQRRATELGLTRIKEKRWTEEELELLAKHAYKHPDLVARILAKHGFSRSRNAIWIAVKRRLGGVRANRPYYTANELSNLLGIDRHAVSRWVFSGMLAAEHAGSERTEKQGGDIIFIRPAAVRKFVATNPEAIDLRKVDSLWFIDLLVNDKANQSGGAK